MRMALFTDQCAPQVGGVALTLSRLGERACEFGHEIALISPKIGSADASGTRLDTQLGGIPAPIHPEILMARPLDPSGARLLDRFRPDLAHAATEFDRRVVRRAMGSPARVAARRLLRTDFPAFLSGYGMTPLHGLGVALPALDPRQERRWRRWPAVSPRSSRTRTGRRIRCGPGSQGRWFPREPPTRSPEATLRALAHRSHLRNMGCAARSFATTRTWPTVIDGLLRECAEVVGANAHAARSGTHS